MAYIGKQPKLNRTKYTPQSSDPSNPAEGDVFYSDGTARPEGLWVYKNAAWVEVGSETTGIVNYLEGTNSNAEVSVGDWVTYADAAGTSPVDGTGGTANITFTRNTTSPLRGTADFKLSKDAVNRQGEGASIDITIDSADQAKILTFSADVDASNVNYANGDLRAYIYDVTNAQVLEPVPVEINAGSGLFQCEFQTASNSTSYRLIFHVASTNATAYDVYFDNIKCGPNTKVQGAFISDWKDYTPTFQGVGTPTISLSQWRRVGDTMEIRGEIISGTVTGSNVEVSIPSGHSVDLGGTASMAAGVAASNGAIVTSSLISTGNILLFQYDTGSSSKGVLTGTILGTGAQLEYNASFKIQGWSSSQVLSSDAGTREVKIYQYGNGGESLTAGVTDIPFATSLIPDSHGAWDGDQFTAPESGLYSYEGYVDTSSTGSLFQVQERINGTQRTIAGQCVDTTLSDAKFSGKVWLEKGEVLSFRLNAAKTLSNSIQHFISINKAGSSQQIAASDNVYASYKTNAGQSITTATTTIIDFEDLDFESSSSLVTTGAAWKFTADRSGLYNVTSRIRVEAVAGRILEDDTAELLLYKNGTFYKVLDYREEKTSPTNAQSVSFDGSCLVQLNAGDYIDVRFNHTYTTAVSLSTDSRYNFVEINRIGL